MKSMMKLALVCLMAFAATACGTFAPVGIVSTWAPSPALEVELAELGWQKLESQNQTHEVSGDQGALLLKHYQIQADLDAIDAEIAAAKVRDERRCFALHSAEPARIMPRADAAYARCMQSRGYVRLKRRATLSW